MKGGVKLILNYNRLVLLIGIIALSACSGKGETFKLPRINVITKEWINFDHSVPAKVIFEDGKNKDTLKSFVKLRGGNSVRYEKKSMSVKIGFDYPFNQDSGTDKWILNANYIDKTLMRHKIAYDLFKQMSEHNKSPDCSYVRVFRNGNYQGIYVLMKRLKENTLGVEKGGFVFKEPKIFLKENFEVDIKNQKFPDKSDSSALEKLDQFRIFIHTSNKEDFDNEIQNFVDFESFVDWYLLLLFSNNGDGVLKNFYLYQQTSNGKIKVAPWDYDHSWGRDGDNEKNMTPNIAENRNVLLNRLLKMETFNFQVQKRWMELREDRIFSLENFNKHIDKNFKIIKSELEKHHQFWPVNSDWYYDVNNIQQEFEIMREFVVKNIEFYDAFFTK